MSSGLFVKAESGHDPDLYEIPPPPIDKHPIFTGAPSVGIVTPDNPHYPTATPGDPHQQMQNQIRALGLKSEATKGSYGAPENSYLVYGPTREQMHDLGKAFGQEAVVYSSGGKHELMYTNGPDDGKYHPSLPHIKYHPTRPFDDYWTLIPGHGYLRLNFDMTKKLPPLVLKPPLSPFNAAKSESGIPELVNGIILTLKKAVAAPRALPHPNSYPWHDAHTNYHMRAVGPGVLVDPADLAPRMMKAMEPNPHEAGTTFQPNHSGSHALTNDPGTTFQHPHQWSPPKKPEENPQFAAAGVSTYGQFAAPYGNVDKTTPSNVMVYPYHGRSEHINKLVADHGYQTYYAGGKYGRPDLANKNCNTKHLMVYDPSEGSGGDFGHTEYTDNWRKVHELAHAVTYPELNQLYGEGRRLGRLGHQRSLREAMRAVHWEWLAAHKQRELSSRLGINISDGDFNKELNTVMHDAVHRAVTGRFTDPQGEGFRPFDHKVPLETALSMVRESAHNLGLQGPHDLIRKSEGSNAVAEKEYDVDQVRKEIAGALKKKIDEYAEGLRTLRERELNAQKLAKVSPPGKFKDLPEKLKDKGYSADSAFAIAWDAKNKADAKKAEDDGADEKHCPSCGHANTPMGSLGRMQHFRCRQCGGDYSFDPKAADEKKPIKKATSPGIDTGSDTMLASETKKNAAEGYTQPGVASAPGSMVSAMKAEMCKACGKSHAMGKCDMDEVKPGKELAKKFKIPGRKAAKAEGIAGYPAKGSDAKKKEMSAKLPDGSGFMTATVGAKKAEWVPDAKAHPDKPEKESVLPDDAKSKVIDAEGSGGDVSKGKKLKKDSPWEGQHPGSAAAAVSGAPAKALSVLGKVPTIPGRGKIKLPGASAKPDLAAVNQELKGFKSVAAAPASGSSHIDAMNDALKGFQSVANKGPMGLTPPPAAVREQPKTPAPGAGANPFGGNKKAAVAAPSAKIPGRA